MNFEKSGKEKTKHGKVLIKKVFFLSCTSSAFIISDNYIIYYTICPRSLNPIFVVATLRLILLGHIVLIIVFYFK